MPPMAPLLRGAPGVLMLCLLAAEDAAQKADLLSAHGAIPGRCMVVLPAEVQKPMQDIGQNLIGQSQSLELSLFLSHRRTDQDFTVLEGNHISGRGIVKKIRMHTRDAARA